MATLSASITRSSSISSVNLTSLGGDDYLVGRGDNLLYNYKSGGTLIGTPSSTWDFTDANQTPTGYSVSGTDGDPTSSFTYTTLYGGFTASGDTWTVNISGVSTNTRTLKLFWSNGFANASVTATLSDNSVSPLEIFRDDGSGSGDYFMYDLEFAAGSSGQSLELKVTTLGPNCFIGWLWVSSEASSGVTAALTGQSITSAQGTMSDVVSKALTGQAITPAQGNLTDVVTKALTGQAITTSQGTLTDNVAYGLSGQAITVSQGTISSDNAVTKTLLGQSITLGQGDVSESVTTALTGQSTSVNQGNITDNISYGITGQSATVSQGNIADAVSVTLTGQQIISSQGTISSGGDVVKSLSGQGVTLSIGTLTVENIPTPHEPPNYLSAGGGGGGTGVDYETERKKKQVVRLMVEQAFNQLTQDSPLIQQKEIKAQVIKEVNNQLKSNTIDIVKIENIIELIKDYEVKMVKKRNDELATIILLLH